MKRVLKLLIFVIILILLIVIVRSTYSKYTEKAIAVVKEDIAKWRILINSTDITTSPSVTDFEIDDFEWTGEGIEHVVEGKVAPGMKGQFELIIDPTDTQVALEYEIIISKPSVTLKDGTTGEINIRFDDIVPEDGKTYQITEDTNGDKVVARIKTLDEVTSTDDNDRIDSLMVKVKWDDDEEYDAIDSEIGSIFGNQIKMPIVVKATQYVGT